MLIKSLKGLVAASVLGLLGMVTGCSAPCGASGRLCAPVLANTSALAGVPVPAAAAPASASDASLAPSLQPAASTSTRIGLLLPLQSAALGAPSAAIRDGFLAGHERDQAGFTVSVIATGDTAQEVLKAYMSALQSNDIIVGPLARNAVAAVAASGTVNKPTVALNNSAGTAVALPQQMVAIGLSVEDEARQVATWAAAEHPHGRALVLAGNATWQGRIATAFHARWSRLGLTAQTMALSFPDGYLDPAQVADLKTRIGTDPPDLLFAALDAAQLRQVRAALANPLPCYGTSSVNPGNQPGTQAEELNGVRLVDLPWEIQPDHPAVMVYPRPVADDLPLDLNRLYALGIDAFRVAREIALHPGDEVRLDGVTGKLKVGAGGFERVEAAAVYRDGGFEPVAPGR
jgi:outer membrane PBP1 activator LpoA protein